MMMMKLLSSVSESAILAVIPRFVAVDYALSYAILGTSLGSATVRDYRSHLILGTAKGSATLYRTNTYVILE